MGVARDKPFKAKLETCPNCGFDAISGSECPRCGVVLAKYLTPEHRAKISARHAAARSEVRPRRSPALLAAVAVGAVLAIAAIVAIVLLLDRDPRYLSSWLQGAVGHEAARSLQAQTPQSLIFYFDQEGCDRCRTFAAEVLSAPEVQQRIATVLKVHLRVRPGAPEEALSVRYQVTSFPALLVVTGEARQEVPIGGAGGLASPAELVAAIDQAFQQQVAPLAIAAGLRALEARQPAQALAEFERALAQEPDSPAALRGRGLAHLALDDSKAALADFVAWLKREPGTAEDLDLVASTALEIGRVDEARLYLDRLIELEPGHRQGRAYQLRAELHVKAGDFSAALADAERACALGNDEGCRVARQNQAALDRARGPGKARPRRRR